MSNAKVVWDGDSKAAQRAAEKLHKQNIRLMEDLRKVKAASAEGSRKQNAGLTSIIKKVGTAAAGYKAARMAIDVGTAALRLMNDESRRGLQTAESHIDAIKRLNQITKGGPEALSAQQTRVNTLAIMSGVNRNVVADLMFDAQSNNFQKAVEPLLKASPVFRETGDFAAAGKVAGKVPGLFRPGAISPLEAVNAALFGAAASNADFAQFGDIAPKAAAGGAAAGATPAGTMGVLSVMAGLRGSPIEAATLMQAYGIKASLDPRLAGKGFVGSVETLQAMPDEERKKFLKDSQELNLAYRLMSENLVVIKERVAGVRQAIQATGTERSQLRAGTARETDQFAAIRELNSARIKYTVALENANSQGAARTETKKLNLQTKSIEAGEGGLIRLGRKSGAEAGAFLSGGTQPDAAQIGSDIGAAIMQSVKDAFMFTPVREFVGDEVSRVLHSIEKNTRGVRRAGGDTGK